MTREQLERSLDRQALRDLLLDLVRAETINPPGSEEAGYEVAKPILEELRFKVDFVKSREGRPNLVAERVWGDPSRTFLFNGHMDVVPTGDRGHWSRPPFDAVVEDGRLYGRGSADMKGGITAFIESVALLDRLDTPGLHGRITLQLVADEETLGYHGTGYLATQGVRADLAVVGEPTELKVVVAAKGALWARVRTRGRSAHGANPSLGVSAIEGMERIMQRLRAIEFSAEHPRLGKPTLNIGTIRGGSKVNMVPDACEIEIDRRMLPGETREGVEQELRASIETANGEDRGLEADLETIEVAEPSEVPVDSEVVRLALQAYEAVRGEPGQTAALFGSTDARFLINRCRIPTVIFGPGSFRQAHTIDEYVEITEVEEAALIYADMLRRFLGGA